MLDSDKKLTIKTSNMLIQRKANQVLSASFGMNNVYIKFVDHTEIQIPWEAPINKANACMNMIQNSKDCNLLFDMENAGNPISIV